MDGNLASGGVFSTTADDSGSPTNVLSSINKIVNHVGGHQSVIAKFKSNKRGGSEFKL